MLRGDSMNKNSTSIKQFDAIFKHSGRVEVSKSAEDRKIRLVRRSINEVTDNTVFLDDLVDNKDRVCNEPNKDNVEAVENIAKNSDIVKEDDVKSSDDKINNIFSPLETDVQEIQVEEEKDSEATSVELIYTDENSNSENEQEPELHLTKSDNKVEVVKPVPKLFRKQIKPKEITQVETKVTETNKQDNKEQTTDTLPTQDQQKGVVNKDLKSENVKVMRREKSDGDIKTINKDKANKTKPKGLSFFERLQNGKQEKKSVKQVKKEPEELSELDKRLQSVLSPQALEIFNKINEEYRVGK